MVSRPIENCYWVVPGKLLAGEYPIDLDEETSRVKLGNLIDGGVSAFIDLTEENELDRSSPLRPYASWLGSACHQRFPIRDGSIPETPEYTAAILDAIDHHINEGRTLYVHCWGGIGRTGTIIGCWLARHERTGQAALDLLRERWKCCPKSIGGSTPETPEQEQYILNWQESR